MTPSVIDLATLTGLRVNNCGTTYLPEREAWIYLGALMEIGAVLYSGEEDDYADLAWQALGASIPFGGLCEAVDELYSLRYTMESPYALCIDPADKTSARVGISDKVRKGMARRLDRVFAPASAEYDRSSTYWWSQQVLNEDFPDREGDGQWGDSDTTAMWKVVETKAAQQRAIACYLLAEMC